MIEEFELLKNIVLKLESDAKRTFNGNHSASVRLRKGLQEVKKIAQVIRMDISNEKYIRKITKLEEREENLDENITGNI